MYITLWNMSIECYVHNYYNDIINKEHNSRESRKHPIPKAIYL